MTNLSINELIGIDGKPEILIALLQVLPRNVGVPSVEVGREVDAYCENQNTELSKQTIEWVRRNKPYFIHQLDFIAMDERNE